MEGEKICFYAKKDKYGEFSNFYQLKEPLVVNNIKYPTTEHLFQASKFDDIEYKKLIASFNSPAKSFILGKQKIVSGLTWRTDMNEHIIDALNRGVKIKSNWEEIKVGVMMNILRLKFNQDLHCKKVLLSTDNLEIVENTHRDSFWGNGGSKNNGKNMLGKCLMNLRKEIREEQNNI